MIVRAAVAALLFALAPVVYAQPAASVPPAAVPAEPAPRVSIEDAYRKEYAFLEAQKRELSSRLAKVRADFERDRARLRSDVDRLEAQLLAARGRGEAINEALAKAELAEQAGVETRELLDATYTQAQSTLAQLGDESFASEAFARADDATRLAQLYSVAIAKLGELGRIRREPGRYYLADGTEVRGDIIRIGNVAAYGVGPQGSGALAPAGGGRYKLWNAPTSDVAQALANGQTPPALKLYVYESLTNAASEPEAKTFRGEMAKGGVIGYVIMALGVVALVLIALRALFLKRAGASVSRIFEAAAPHVRAQRTDAAIDAVKRTKGSAARVVTAALRNIDRDREHLEDIVSESILHESTHLNRFAGVITMIAGVAPLLGLLGTVTGMIQTFDILTEFGNADPKLLSSGIATALVTTEQGLVVAIPCLLFGNLLNGWAESIKDDMEKAALSIVNLYQDVLVAATRLRAAA